MARRAVLAFAVTALIGAAAVIWRAAEAERPVAFPLGPAPVLPVAELGTGEQVCQSPIPLPTDASGVRFSAGAAGPGPPLAVAVRDAGGRVLATGTAPGGYPDRATIVVRFPTVRAGRTVSVCIRNRGTRTVHPYGDDQVKASGTVVSGRRHPVDVSMYFLRERPRSALSLVPTMFRRASLFRFGWVGAWTYWVLAALIAVGVPVLCGIALARATRESEPGGGERP